MKLLGIYKAINILLPDRDRANGWMRAPNKAPFFGGQPALSRMTSGNVGDLFLVRQYLGSRSSPSHYTRKDIIRI